MANHFFRFKRFHTLQDRCAMKVTADACLFGGVAIGAERASIVDVGTGTGLLSLMAAQRFPNARVTAIEIDPIAAGQARANVAGSPWAERIVVFTMSVQQYAERCRVGLEQQSMYAWINPPFFSAGTPSVKPEKRMAWHEYTLTQQDMWSALSDIILTDGVVSVLLPLERLPEASTLAATYSFLTEQVLTVKAFPHLPGKRGVLFARKVNSMPSEIHPERKSIVIQEDEHTYTDEFKQIMQDFYLFL